MDARPPYFYAKKWSMFTFCLIQIIILIVFAALASTMVDRIIASEGGNLSQSEKDAVRAFSLGMIIGSSVIGCLFQLVGLFGAWKENYCLSCTYAVLSAIGFVFSFYRSFAEPINWASTVISLIVTIIAIMFTIDLRKIRHGTVSPRTAYPNY